MEDIQGFRELEQNNQVDDLISFIERNLPGFVASSEFVHITKIRKGENRHSNALCTYMTNKSKSYYYFVREEEQSGSSSIDIGVRMGPVLIFTIEAKILPTPKSSQVDKRNEYEYVYGHSAGIQRFKDGKHGLDDESKLFPRCGLIAYIKQNNFDYWFGAINKWILDAEWPESEKLVKNYFNEIAKLESLHHRSNGAKLQLHHFWVMVQNM